MDLFSKPDMQALSFTNYYMYPHLYGWQLETLEVTHCTQACTCKRYTHVSFGSDSLLYIYMYISDVYMYMHIIVLEEMIFQPLIHVCMYHLKTLEK